MIPWYKAVDKINISVNFWLDCSFCFQHSISCSSCDSSLVSLDAKSPQHKFRTLIVQRTATFLSVVFINLKVSIAFFRSTLTHNPITMTHNYEEFKNLEFLGSKIVQNFTIMLAGIPYHHQNFCNVP